MSETDATLLKEHEIIEKDGEWCVMSHDGSRSFGCYPDKAEAHKRLGQIEGMKKRKGMMHAMSKVLDWFEHEAAEDPKAEEYEMKDGVPMSGWAYTPDPKKPSTWKLRIDDAAHVGGAVAALGKGFRGEKVDLPSDARAGVIAKVRAAWKKHNPDKDEKDMPDVLMGHMMDHSEDEPDETALDELRTRIHSLRTQFYGNSQTNSLKGVEIFRTGQWNGDKYAESDLDHMVTAFDRVGFRPAIKMGHDKTVGGRAWGWVSNLRRSGDRLLADFEDIPAEVMKVIREHGFDRVSSEIYWNFKRSGETYPRVLRAVALLGHEPPAVADLAPLRAVLSAHNGQWDRELNYELEFEMSDVKFDELVGQVADLEKQLADAEKAKADLEAAEAETDEAKQELATAEKQVEELSEALNAAKGEVKAAQREYAELKAQVKSQDAQIKTLTEAQAKIAEERRQEHIARKVDAFQWPAARAHIKMFYDWATSQTQEPLASRQVDFALDGEKTETVSAEQIIDSFAALVNGLMKQKVFAEVSQSDGLYKYHRPEEGQSATNPAEAGRKLDALTREHMEKNGVKDYSEAFAIVRKAHPDLAAQYSAPDLN